MSCSFLTQAVELAVMAEVGAPAPADPPPAPRSRRPNPRDGEQLRLS